MSGEKNSYVNIRRSEYNRMMRSCNRLDQLDKNVQKNMESIEGNLRRDFRKRMDKIGQRHANIEKRMGGLSEEMQRVETEQNRRLQQQSQQFQRSIESINNELKNQREEYLGLIQTQSENFSKALQEQKKDLQGQIKNIHEKIAQKQESEKNQAYQWFSDVQNYLDMISENYRHEKFLPGSIEGIRQEMEINRSNLSQGNYQAAIASIQQSFVRASNIRLELERLEMEWEAYLEGAKNNAAQVLATCDAQYAARIAFDTEEGSKEVAAEIDFWTNGRLSELRKQAEDEKQRFVESDNLSLEDLKKSIGDSNHWREECLSLTEKAKEALIASQLRNNIGQAIESVMNEDNWEITDATYEGQDLRGAVHIKMENLQGDELVTIVTPVEKEESSIENKINISFFDRNTNDEVYRESRVKSILKALQEQGIDCGPPQCVPGTENRPCENELKLDFEAVRKKKPVSETQKSS